MHAHTQTHNLVFTKLRPIVEMPCNSPDITTRRQFSLMSPWCYSVTRDIINSSQSNNQWKHSFSRCRECVCVKDLASQPCRLCFTSEYKTSDTSITEVQKLCEEKGSWSKGHLAAAFFTNRINAFSFFGNTEKVCKSSGVVRASWFNVLKSGTSCWILMDQMSVRGRGQSDLFSLIRNGIFSKPTCKHCFSP